MSEPTVVEVLSTGPDGSQTVRVTSVVTVPAPVRPDPVPPTPVPPTVPTAVRVGSSGRVHQLAAVDPSAASNPAGAGFDGYRGPNQLVVYTQRTGPVSPANRFGDEVAVTMTGPMTGVVAQVRRRETAPDGDSGTVVPDGGVVLSGHFQAGAVLVAGVRVGDPVEFLTGTPPPQPTPGQANGRTIAVYMMDGVGSIGQVPGECNQVRVAFLQGGGLVEWGGDSPAKTASDLTRWRSTGPGLTVLPSVGGQGGRVDMAVVGDAVRRVEQSFPCDGIDWDVEASTLDVARVVAVSRELAAGRESSWVTAFTPPGGPPVAVYLEAASRCRDAGLRVQFGQQLYATRITLDDVLRQTALAVSRLGEESVLLGCMVGSDPAKYSTVDQWESYLRAVRDRWPGIGGAYLWESSRPGTGEWARRMAGVLR